MGDDLTGLAAGRARLVGKGCWLGSCQALPKRSAIALSCFAAADRETMEWVFAHAGFGVVCLPKLAAQERRGSLICSQMHC